jgi:hypothetical protein
MTFEELIKELKQKIGPENVQIDSYGVRRFWFEQDRYLIHLRSSSNEKSLYLYAKITSTSDFHKTQIYEILLEANLFGQGADNLIFALDKATDSLILMQTFEMATLTFESYWNELPHFIGYLSYWKTKIDHYIKNPIHQNSQENMLELMSKRNQTILFI